jgi:DNA polymerase III epsilon subunit-like protein
MQARDQTITIIDFETGGRDKFKHQATQVATLIVDLKSLAVLGEYESFIAPYGGLTYDKEVLKKTMVTEDDILNGKPLKTVVKELIEVFKQGAYTDTDKGKTILCGHNMNFDKGFSEELFKHAGKDIYDYVQLIHHDTLAMAQQMWWGDGEKLNLTACCKRIGYRLTGAHGAMNDVRGTYELFKHFTKRVRESHLMKQTKTGMGINQTRKFFHF